jgi:hypothetical protein
VVVVVVVVVVVFWTGKEEVPGRVSEREEGRKVNGML